MPTSPFDLPRSRDEIAQLIPHQGEMCLLERVVAADEQHIVCTTTSHRSLRNPLRVGDRIAAVHLCEYGAQAMAVHGGLLARAHGGIAKPGLLIALRDVQLQVATIDPATDELRVIARQISATQAAWQYHFEVFDGAHCLASGRAMVMLQRNE